MIGPGAFDPVAFDPGAFQVDEAILFRPTFELAGQDVSHVVRRAGVTIRDVLNDAPNTAALTVEAGGPVVPAVGQPFKVTLGAGTASPLVLFAGLLQAVDHSYEASRPAERIYPLRAIDDTAKANWRRPFATFRAVSATTIAEAIAGAYAPGFATQIEAGLPAVSITFDGSETLIAALVRLGNLVGGYAKVEDNTIYLFREDLTGAPDPIDDAHPFLDDPPITISVDGSQLRTRMFGKGYGENIPTDVLAGETILPILDGAQFNAAGGLAITGVTADGAQSLKLAYSGVVRGLGGTLVGTGTGPSTAPAVVLASGTGIESGDHDWAYVFVTAAGRSKPGPVTRVFVGLLSAPATAPVVNPPIPGGAMDVGAHRYYAVFRTASGQTLPGPASNLITVTEVAAPTIIGVADFAPGSGPTSLDPSAVYAWKYSFRRLSDGVETATSPASNSVVTSAAPVDYARINLSGCQAAPPGFTRQWYRTEGNGSVYKRCVDLEGDQFGEVGGYLFDGNYDGLLGPAEPATNGTRIGTCSLVSIPVSSNPLVTHVDLYREFNDAGAATARLAFSVPNGTTSAGDALANAGLGALAPSTNTAVANRASVSWPAGPPGVTDIELYRTPLGSAQLKKFFTVGSNTAGTTIDSTPDASLTTNAPTDDTSGLTQPSGQVNPGATTLPVASAAPFRALGGWARLGQQVIRYTGISGQSLTGIPASGPGALLTAVLYGQQATPAPALVGVDGIAVPLQRGSAVHIWVQRDDVGAQAEQAARAGGDGVVEYLFTDARRGEASLIERCDAELALFARPIVTITYATRDRKTKSGKSVTVALTSPVVSGVFTIQEVTITNLGGGPYLDPKFLVKASSVRFSLEDTVRRLIAALPSTDRL